MSAPRPASRTPAFPPLRPQGPPGAPRRASQHLGPCGRAQGAGRAARGLVLTEAGAVPREELQGLSSGPATRVPPRPGSPRGARASAPLVLFARFLLRSEPRPAARAQRHHGLPELSRRFRTRLMKAASALPGGGPRPGRRRQSCSQQAARANQRRALPSGGLRRPATPCPPGGASGRGHRPLTTRRRLGVPEAGTRVTPLALPCAPGPRREAGPAWAPAGHRPADRSRWPGHAGGVSSLRPDAAPLHPRLCPSLLSLQGHASCGAGAHLVNNHGGLVSPRSPL